MQSAPVSQTAERSALTFTTRPSEDARRVGVREPPANTPRWSPLSALSHSAQMGLPLQLLHSAYGDALRIASDDAAWPGSPREGRAPPVRQLKNAPESVRVECFTARGRGAGAAELLKTVRGDPTSLITDPSREIRSFRVAMTTPMGAKRGRGRGAFIDSVLASVDTFYGDVLGDLKAWAAAPPKMRPAVPSDTGESEEVRPASLASTDFSSQDGASVGVPAQDRSGS